MGEWSKRKRIYAYIKLIHFVVWQRLTQHCKAIILLLPIETPTQVRIRHQRGCVVFCRAHNEFQKEEIHP